MVLDSADDVNLFFRKSLKTPSANADTHLSRFIPRSSIRTVFITTYDRRITERIPVTKCHIVAFPISVTEAEAKLLRLKLPELSEVDQLDVRELVDVLANLPLATSQAAASSITEHRMVVREYLQTFRSSGRLESTGSLIPRP